MQFEVVLCVMYLIRRVQYMCVCTCVGSGFCYIM